MAFMVHTDILSGRVYACGQSRGGMMASELAISVPERPHGSPFAIRNQEIPAGKDLSNSTLSVPVWGQGLVVL